MKKEEFKQLLENVSDTLLLDIREADELTSETILEGSKNVPMGKVFTEVKKGNLSKDVPIVVFCRTGGRAGIVVNELKEQGYDIDGLEGGLDELLA